MRILITGASGYIGRLTIAPLIAKSADVHAASRREIPAASGLTRHQVNLLDAGAPERLIKDVNPDVVLHFAWNATPGVYLTTPENHDWRRATVALARTFFKSGGLRFVTAGSCFEYDAPQSASCEEHTTPLRAATIYGESKTATWRDVEDLAHAAGGAAACGRIFYVFGGDEYPSRLVPSVARALLSGQPALCSHGEQLRDFLHVEEVAGAFVALTSSAVAGPVNIASGHAVRVRDLIEGLGSRLGRPDLVRLGARPMTEPMRITANVSRLRDEVGWQPSMDLNQGLDEAVGFWRRRSAEA